MEVKNLTQYLLVFLSILSISLESSGQEITLEKENPYDYKLVLPELGVLIDSALANHGLLGSRKLEVKVKESDLKLQKNYWTRNFGIQAAGRYGTINNFSSTAGQESTVALSTNLVQVDYYIGAYVKFPVIDALNRKTEIKKAEAQIEQAKSLVKFQRDEVVEQVMKYYEDLLLKQDLLELRSKNLANANVSIQMAEKEFKKGAIPIYEYVRISDITARIEEDYKNAKSDFVLSKRLLENFTGLRFN